MDKRSPGRFLHPGLPLRRVLLGALIIVGVLLPAALIVHFSGSSEAQTPQPSPLWPPFTMTFTVRDHDPLSGQLVADVTMRVVVTSEYAWRAERIRDGLNPKKVGSWSEFRNGVVYSYDAEQRVNRQLALPGRRGVTDIMLPELSPTFLPNVRGGSIPNSRLGTPLTPGRVAIVSSEPARCPSPRPATGPCAAAGTGTYDQRIEYDPRSLGGRYIGGVPVFGEGRLNGQVIHTFQADSVEFR